MKTSADLDSLKRKLAKKYKIPCPDNLSLLKAYHKITKNETSKRIFNLEELLRTRPVRSLSGIVNVSVLTKPHPCPGKCLYCPTEKNIPKSYVSGEPAVERAKALQYNPFLQVKKRIEMLKSQGHSTDKIELRIVGGTWSYYPKKYQEWFVKRCFTACNQAEIKKQKAKSKNRILEKEQKINEGAKQKVVGLSVETRPDFIDMTEIKWLRKLGVTMVELGVQSIYDDVLKKNLRDHLIQETILATKLLKDAGFKVLYQMMPNLPDSDLRRDEKMFQELFSNPDFQPDLLKIYPCALLKKTPLYGLWKKGQYKTYSEKQLINLIKSIKKEIPYYVRIQRIARDIPSKSIVMGPAKISNIRQMIAGLAKKEGWRCHCIRCREVREKYDPKEKIYLFRNNYQASGGKEIFLSFENKRRTKLYSLLRLRIPSPECFISALKSAAIVREIHTYGQSVPMDKKKKAPQHQGLGKKLVKEAEKIIRKEFGTRSHRHAKRCGRVKKIAVISAIGARNYFKKLGYSLYDTYMVKKI